MRNTIDNPRRSFLVDALGYGLFAGTNLIGLSQPSYALGDLPSKLPAGRSIYKLKGEVLVDGSTADIQTWVSANSTIRTGNQSEIIFVVVNDAFILRSNSELKLTGSGLVIEGLRIITGKLLSVFGKNTARRSITTTTATIGIRGTGIYVESDPELSYVCTCYGQTLITSRFDPDVQQLVQAQRHDTPLYVLPEASGRQLIVPAPVINHTDSELALIEALVGRKTPFADSAAGYKAGGSSDY